jgi:hypothetical protein
MDEHTPYVDEQEHNVDKHTSYIDERDVQGGPNFDKQEPSVDEHTPSIDEPDFQGERNVDEQEHDVDEHTQYVDEPDIQGGPHVNEPHPKDPLSPVAEAVWSRVQANPASTTSLLSFISSKSHKRYDADTIIYYRFAIEFNEKWFGVNVQVNVLNIFFSYW